MRDFPLRHSSLRGLCALSSESGGCLSVAAGWVFCFLFSAVAVRPFVCPSVCPSQVGILADSHHDVDGISLAHSESVIFPFLRILRTCVIGLRSLLAKITASHDYESLEILQFAWHHQYHASAKSNCHMRFSHCSRYISAAVGCRSSFVVVEKSTASSNKKSAVILYVLLILYHLQCFYVGPVKIECCCGYLSDYLHNGPRLVYKWVSKPWGRLIEYQLRLG